MGVEGAEEAEADVVGLLIAYQFLLQELKWSQTEGSYGQASAKPNGVLQLS